MFLSAYDNDRWAGCAMQWLDQQQDGAVEAIATRSDGRTLAIEHTLMIESFIGEREDLERFKSHEKSDRNQRVNPRWRVHLLWNDN
jgi:hypothetical protein